MRGTTPLAVLIAALALSTEAPAHDDLTGTRGQLEERGHRIALTLAAGHATLIVQRTVENFGKRHDQADWLIDLPETAVATLLRTRGVLDGRPHWFDGELLEAEAAAAKYHELTGIGGYYPKDPALLSWRAPGRLALQVFPIPPGERKTVSYTLKMPTTYHDGRHEVTLPLIGLEGSPAAIVVRPAQRQDRLIVDDQPFAAGGALARPTGEDLHVGLVPAWAPTAGGALATKRFGDGRVLVHYRVEAAPRLGEVPRGARVVVVLDWSRSVPQALCEAAVAAASAYLHHFEDARVEVVTFDRRVRRRHGRFVPVGQAIADLADLDVERGNGSNVDRALAKADELLAAAPAGPARRVLLLGDLLARSSLDVRRLQGVLRRSGALLHVARVDEGSPSLEVDREGEWSGVARATGGLLWQAQVSAEATDEPAMRAATEEWARPIRLHRFTLVAPGVELQPTSGAEALEAGTLPEGSGVAGLQIAGYEPPWLEITGELWSRPIRVRLEPDPAEARLWSALVFGDDVRDELSEPEMMVLARYGRSVSPVTSYLAIEPGVRPSTEGFGEDEGYGVGGLGMLSTGSGGGGTGQGQPQTFDHLGWLRAQLGPARERCGYRAAVSIDIETTLDEVVDVTRVAGAREGDPACLREAAWALDLPPDFTFERHQWTVSLRRE